ncbi:MAG: transglutaminase domain-containing protein, partial [Acidobacteria bacterium]|nr:transglutaminase domain-containing protein [Acidobacteriota bacterium]
MRGTAAAMHASSSAESEVRFGGALKPTRETPALPEMLMRCLITSVVLLIGVLATKAADDPSIIKGSDEFEFIYRVTLPEIEGVARLWIPLAKTDAFQSVRVEESSIPVKWEKVQDRDYGNDIFVLHPQLEDSGKTIELRYRVVRKEKAAYPGSSDETSRYLRPEKLVPADETFKTLAEEAVAGKTGNFERAKALYDHVLGRMRYDKSGSGWGRGDALYACDAKTGNCTDFHAYFIALTRSVGIPGRFAIGATIPAEKNEGNIEGYHCWAEFFADGQWIPVDISEAWKNPKLADYYFGHNPANRFELTKGRDLIIDPAPATGPINFLAYPLLEMDGKVVKVETSFTFRRTRQATARATD